MLLSWGLPVQPSSEAKSDFIFGNCSGKSIPFVHSSAIFLYLIFVWYWTEYTLGSEDWMTLFHIPKKINAYPLFTWQKVFAKPILENGEKSPDPSIWLAFLWEHIFPSQVVLGFRHTHPNVLFSVFCFVVGVGAKWLF